MESETERARRCSWIRIHIQFFTETFTYEETDQAACSDPFGGSVPVFPCAAEDSVILSDDSSDFVLLSDAVPDAILEIRYHSTYNFVGDCYAAN